MKTGSKTGKQPPAQPAETPALPATLDIKVDMPGNIFVGGHGLDSEWRGKLAITGTSAARLSAGIWSRSTAASTCSARPSH
ncbi:MAG: hypothetical protein JO358_18880 [Alphaproteobacteria bacterium]|nr:hypothetical protein [Alphaproteobacteria bacterium]